MFVSILFFALKRRFRGSTVSVFAGLEVQISFQAQYFVDPEVQISWQAQYFVDFEAQVSW